MSLFNTVTMTRRRYPGCDYGDNGRWVDGSSSDLSFKGTFQPANGKEMQVLPEGRREQETFKIYTSTELRTSIQADGSISEDGEQADEVIHNGRVYEVVAASPWQNQIINHYRAFVQNKLEANS